MGLQGRSAVCLIHLLDGPLARCRLCHLCRVCQCGLLESHTRVWTLCWCDSPSLLAAREQPAAGEQPAAREQPVSSGASAHTVANCCNQQGVDASIRCIHGSERCGRWLSEANCLRAAVGMVVRVGRRSEKRRRMPRWQPLQLRRPRVAGYRRQQIRNRFNIRGTECGDYVAWLCCPVCALCQETRTLAHNQVWASLPAQPNRHMTHYRACKPAPTSLGWSCAREGGGIVAAVHGRARCELPCTSDT